jgi:isocitrate/isopropylmalate dehydrogenase
MLSAALMLDHLEQRDAANRLRSGIRIALGKPETRTGDLGGKANTMQYTYAVMRAMDQNPDASGTMVVRGLD